MRESRKPITLRMKPDTYIYGVVDRATMPANAERVPGHISWRKMASK